MDNVQFVCAGNCFTKPLMCWSLQDWALVIPIMFVILVIVSISKLEKRGK